MKNTVIVFFTALTLFLTAGYLTAFTQDIPGELVFEEPFEGELPSEWYMVANEGAIYEYLGFVEPGPEEGDAFVIYINTPETVVMNHLQFSYGNLTPPEGSDLYDWRITFWVRTLVTPFLIRPIIAMNVDPWSGTSAEFTIENPEEWTFVDLTILLGDFLRPTLSHLSYG